MLGLLIRFPRTATPVGWIGAGVAYLAADLMTGASVEKAIVLNAANLVGVVIGYRVYRKVSAETASLRDANGMFHLLFASAMAGAAAGVVGAFANPLLLGGGLIEGWSFWFATELVNYVTFLPVILSIPNRREGELRPDSLPDLAQLQNIGPVLAVVGSCVIAAFGGPGAIAYPVPALLWCGVTYSVFRTALLTSLYGCWILIAVSAGILPHFIEVADMSALVSIRIAVALVSMAPIMLASMMHSRNELLATLHHQATHDILTGLSNRSAFLDAAEELMGSSRRSVSVMMIDIDRFKAINDSHGHAGGDRVLKEFAQKVRSCLRANDVFARMGGEEFAILVRDCAKEDAAHMADRVLRMIREAPVVLDDGAEIPVTASIGLVHCQSGGGDCIDNLLAEADAELYRAKQNGRDRVEILERS
ncbi:diguanylate cyclase [Oricola sp.]|uniref:GGDEF domain-containing protein n=1 Tax=Oricola sp. TaxID=1979950 RepID=UPI00351874DB